MRRLARPRPFRAKPQRPGSAATTPGRALLAGLLALALVVPATATATAAGRTARTPQALLELVETANEKGQIRLLISLRNLGAQRQVIESLDRTDAQVLIRYDLLPYLLLNAGPDTVRSLVANPLVTGFTEDLPQKPALDSSVPVINGDDVRNIGLRGDGTAVAILDTGIDRDHPFFNNVVSEACYSNAGGSGSGVSLCPDGTNAQTGNGSADAETAQCLNMGNNICDHGTHVAGTAMGDGTGVTGAPVAGVAPDADLIGIQVFTRFNDSDDCGDDPAPCVRTYASDQVLGLQRVLALQTGNTLASDIVAANMSLGNADNNSSACDGDSRKAAIDLLLAQNVATVISAGNEGHPAGVGTPGCISSAITVGSTTDTDGISGFSNRGTRLDLFAPGSAITSSVPDDAYGNMQGTSMAAPHVTGAWAVLRGEYPDESVADILQTLQNTGVDIDYTSAGSSITTPRIDLLAAVQELNAAPVIGRDNADATVSEGQTATNTGTFSDPEGDAVTLTSSVGTVTDTGGGTWAWSFATNDGPAQGQTVTITATDDKTESATVTFPLVVNNVAPTVTADPAQVTSIDEGDFLSASASFSDPGWADTYGSTIDWGTPTGDSSTGTTNVTTDGPPQDQGTSTGSFQYGDNGTFDVELGVTDDDGGTGTDSFTVTVDNVAPTAAIDLGDATNVNGTPTIIGDSGSPVDFSARSTDPGSDDILASWDWGNGGASPDVTTEHFVSGPLPDPPHLFNPAFSPSVQPRDVTDEQSNTFGDACEYSVTFTSADDDEGSASDEVQVIITGTADKVRGAGYWQTRYSGLGTPGEFTTAQLDCLLTVVGHMSTVFDEARAMSTRAQAVTVLKTNASNMRDMLDRFVATSWLNFGNGSFELGDQVDTNGDGTPDTTFAAALATAEAVRLDPAATRAQLEEQKNVLERINGK